MDIVRTPENQAQAEKERLKAVDWYLRRYISKTFNKLTKNQFGIALFSKDGTILRLYPEDEDKREELFHGEIRELDCWMDAGENAVSEGLRVRRSRTKIGSENTHPVLQKYAIYFSVMNLRDLWPPFSLQDPCGIAIIAPLSLECDAYRAMSVGISHDIMVNIQFRDSSIVQYERSGLGVLVADNLMADVPSVTYTNRELFRLLKRKPEDFIFQPLEKLFPKADNEMLWKMLEQYETCKNLELRLVSEDSEVDCIVSSDAYLQPSIKAGGVIFYLTTQRKISEETASRIANGAIKTFDDIIGEDPELLSLIERAKRMAMTDSNILILGENGTGKDVFAQAIHNASRRRNKPFIAVNCGAIPRDLIESELFGYESGAFTGAKKNGNMGKFELAMGGTLFLDEIGEMPLDLQAKLLRAVEQKQIMRLGGSRYIDLDVKIIAATNVDMSEMIRQKRFREDLFYRLSAMRLRLMPLRERIGDVPILANHFSRKISARIGRDGVMLLTPEAEKLLCLMKWYGNVRELQNLIECIVQLYPGDYILPEQILENISHEDRLILERNIRDRERMTRLPEEEAPTGQTGNSKKSISASDRTGQAQRVPIRYDLTKEQIMEALEKAGNNRSLAAELLGISRRTFYRRLEEYGL